METSYRCLTQSVRATNFSKILNLDWKLKETHSTHTKLQKSYPEYLLNFILLKSFKSKNKQQVSVLAAGVPRADVDSPDGSHDGLNSYLEQDCLCIHLVCCSSKWYTRKFFQICLLLQFLQCLFRHKYLYICIEIQNKEKKEVISPLPGSLEV